VSELVVPVGQKICYSNLSGMQAIRKKVREDFAALVEWNQKLMVGISGNCYAFKGKFDDFEAVANSDEYLWSKIDYTVQDGERIATYVAKPDLKKVQGIERNDFDISHISFRKKVVFVESKSFFIVHYFGNDMQFQWTKKSEGYQSPKEVSRSNLNSLNPQRPFESQPEDLFKLKPFKENQHKIAGGPQPKLVVKKDDICHFWNEKTYIEPKSGNVYVFGGRSDQYDLIVASDKYEWVAPDKDNSRFQRTRRYFAKPDRSKIVPPLSKSTNLNVTFRKAVLFYPENNMYIVYYFGDDKQYPWTLTGSDKNSCKSLRQQTNHQKGGNLASNDLSGEKISQTGALNYSSQVNRPSHELETADCLESPILEELQASKTRKNSNTVETLNPLTTQSQELDSVPLGSSTKESTKEYQNLEAEDSSLTTSNASELVKASKLMSVSSTLHSKSLPQAKSFNKPTKELENLKVPCEIGNFCSRDSNLTLEENSEEDKKQAGSARLESLKTIMSSDLRFSQPNILHPVATHLKNVYISNQLEMIKNSSEESFQRWTSEKTMSAIHGNLYVFKGIENDFEDVAISDNMNWKMISLKETTKRKTGYFCYMAESDGEKASCSGPISQENLRLKKRIIFLKENSVFVVFYNLAVDRPSLADLMEESLGFCYSGRRSQTMKRRNSLDSNIIFNTKKERLE